MNPVTIKLSKLVPGTLQCLNIEEYLGTPVTEKARRTAFVEIVAQMDIHGDRKKRVLVFSKNIDPSFLAKSIYHLKTKYYHEIMLKDPHLKGDDKFSHIMASRSKILIHDSNQFNMGSIYSQTIEAIKENDIEAVIIEGLNLEKRTRNKLIMLAMRGKCCTLVVS